MRTVWKIAPLAAVLSAVPLLANAGKVEGVGIGAGVGAIVAGPVGAVVGGVVGYKVGGPNIVGRRYRSCWRLSPAPVRAAPAAVRALREIVLSCQTLWSPSQRAARRGVREVLP
jgi:hypothetical protein